MNRSIWVLCAASGFLGVALGAFGAHALKALPADQLAWWETGARYHLIHAVAIGLAAAKGWKAPAWAFAGGIAVFSGSLYALALTHVRALGAVTPIGGVLFLTGWALLGYAAWKESAQNPHAR